MFLILTEFFHLECAEFVDLYTALLIINININLTHIVSIV